MKKLKFKSLKMPGLGVSFSDTQIQITEKKVEQNNNEFEI